MMESWAILLLGVVLGALAFFEPCAIASNVLFTQYVQRISRRQRFGQLGRMVLARIGLLAALGLAVSAFARARGLPCRRCSSRSRTASSASSSSQPLRLHPRAAHQVLRDCSRAEGRLTEGTKIGLTLPACTIPLAGALLMALAGTASPILGAITMSLFAVFFSVPAFIYSFRPATPRTLRFLDRSARATPYLTGGVVRGRGGGQGARGLAHAGSRDASGSHRQHLHSELRARFPRGARPLLQPRLLPRPSPSPWDTSPPGRAMPATPSFSRGLSWPGHPRQTFSWVFCSRRPATSPWRRCSDPSGGMVIGPVLVLLGLRWLNLVSFRLPVLVPKARRTATYSGAFLLGSRFPRRLPVLRAGPRHDPHRRGRHGEGLVFGRPPSRLFLGRGLPVLAASTGLGAVEQMRGMERFVPWIEKGGGVALVLAGLYMVWSYAYPAWLIDRI